MSFRSMLSLPFRIVFGLAQILAVPVIAVALSWWLLPIGWTAVIAVAALLYLRWFRWAAVHAEGGVIRMLAARAIVRAEARAAAREAMQMGGRR